MNIKSKIKTISWSVLGAGCIVLLVAAMKSKEEKACKNIEVNIKGATQHRFVKKDDVMNVLVSNGIESGRTLSDIDLLKAETQLEKNTWIKDAELFFDNRQSLYVNITEREPAARVFTMSGNSFYIDSTGLRLPVNENATARVIVFTSFPSDRTVLSKPDSLVLTDVKSIANYINRDSFLTAQTAQINITQQRTYEISPVVGNQVIRIGNADSLNEKFTKLIAFYKEVFAKTGFEKYSVIDVQYHGQVVAVRRGETNAIADTSSAMHELKNGNTTLNAVMKDTMYSAPLYKSVEINKTVKKASAIKKVNVVTNKKQTKKTIHTALHTTSRKPKAVMKKVKR